MLYTSGSEVKTAYEMYLNASLLNVTEHFLYQLCYDTVWILANALNNTLTGYQKRPQTMKFTYVPHNVIVYKTRDPSLHYSFWF